MPLIGLVSVAFAHDAVGSYGLRPFVRDGDLVGAWTTWGVVRREENSWLRVCEEALPGLRDVWLRDDGVFLFATDAGLVESLDGGCTSTLGAIQGPLRQWLDAGSAMYALLERSGGDTLLVSEDEWRTHVEIAVPGGLDIRSLAAATDGTLWLTALHEGAPVVYRGSEAGFVAQSMPDPNAVLWIAHGPAPDGVGITLSSVLPAGTAQLWTSDGEDVQLLADLPLAATGYGCLSERCFVAINQSVLLSWERSEPAPVTLQTVQDGPARCLWALGGELWGCTAVDTPAHFLRSSDGVTFSEELFRSLVFERQCPAGSPGDACTLLPDLPDLTADTGKSQAPPTSNERRCGCATTERSGQALGFFTLALCCARSRRRQVTHKTLENTFLFNPWTSPPRSWLHSVTWASRRPPPSKRRPSPSR